MAVKESKPKRNLGSQFKMRSCMNPECRAKFLSESYGNRFCNPCRHKETEIEMHRVYI